MWEHRKLAAYPKAIEVAVELDALARSIPPARRDLRDQLQRASASVALNLAEGAAEFSPDGKARFYRMARRSAAECVAIFDILDGLLKPHLRTQRARSLLDEIAAMLTALIRRQTSSSSS